MFFFFFLFLRKGEGGLRVKKKKKFKKVDSVNMCIILLKHVQHNHELMLFFFPHFTYLIVRTVCVSACVWGGG